MKRMNNMLWGILLIVVGVIFGLNALNITNINVFFDGWWTLFIIVPCFIDLFKEEEKTGNVIGLVIGICLFLACQFFGFVQNFILNRHLTNIMEESAAGKNVQVVLFEM